jgi:hypothetical protein
MIHKEKSAEMTDIFYPAIAVAVWVVVTPAIGFALLYLVGETIEHFTP